MAHAPRVDCTTKDQAALGIPGFILVGYLRRGFSMSGSACDTSAPGGVGEHLSQEGSFVRAQESYGVGSISRRSRIPQEMVWFGTGETRTEDLRRAGTAPGSNLSVRPTGTDVIAGFQARNG